MPAAAWHISITVNDVSEKGIILILHHNSDISTTPPSVSTCNAKNKVKGDKVFMLAIKKMELAILTNIDLDVIS